MDEIKVMIVDDHDIVRDGLQTLMAARAPEIKVVGIAANGREAVALAEETAPDVVLMDVRMPETDGISATKEIRRRCPQTKILILTSFDEEECIVGSMRAGANGYLLKDVPFHELIKAIHTVYEGGVLMQEDVARILIGSLGATGIAPHGKAGEDSLGSAILSARERAILGLVAQGIDNKAIAGRLFLSEGTVRNYVSRIYELIGVHDRAQAVVWAMRHGIIAAQDE